MKFVEEKEKKKRRNHGTKGSPSWLREKHN